MIEAKGWAQCLNCEGFRGHDNGLLQACTAQCLPWVVQAAEAEYEAALEARRREVEAERARRDLQQLRLVEAITRAQQPGNCHCAFTAQGSSPTVYGLGSVAPSTQWCAGFAHYDLTCCLWELDSRAGRDLNNSVHMQSLQSLLLRQHVPRQKMMAGHQRVRRRLAMSGMLAQQLWGPLIYLTPLPLTM